MRALAPTPTGGLRPEAAEACAETYHWPCMNTPDRGPGSLMRGFGHVDESANPAELITFLERVENLPDMAAQRAYSYTLLA